MERKRNGGQIGPYYIMLYFLDGSKLKVRENLTDEESWEVYNEYISSIGARVGTTKKIAIFHKDDDEIETNIWEYQRFED